VALVLVVGLIGSPTAGTPAASAQASVSSTQTAKAAPAATFVDITEHWARREVELLAAKGVAEALAGSAFGPEVPVNRGDLAKMLVLGLGHGGEAESLANEPSFFADVTMGDPDRPYIELAYELGIVNGYPDRTFHPDADISRSEMTAMILRALGWEKLAQSAAAAKPVYPDQAEIAPWAMGYALLAHQTGIIKGYSDGTFRPLASTTRSQAAVLVARMLGAMGRLYDLSGTVRTIDLVDGAVGLEVLAGDRRLVVYTGTRVYRNDQPAGLADVAYFDEVQVVLDAVGRVTFLDAHMVSVEGVFKSLDPSTLRVQYDLATSHGPDGPPAMETRSITVLPEAAVFRNGKAVGLSALRPGDRLVAILKVIDGSNRARAVDAVGTSVAGTFDGYNATKRVLTMTAGGSTPPETRQYQVASGAAIFLDGQRAGMTDLRPGDSIELALDPQGGQAIFVNAERPR
jgi:hypothetical protein